MHAGRGARNGCSLTGLAGRLGKSEFTVNMEVMMNQKKRGVDCTGVSTVGEFRSTLGLVPKFIPGDMALWRCHSAASLKEPGPQRSARSVRADDDP
jgi:hypothetical protein